MNLAIAGFRHGHIFSLIKWSEDIENLNIVSSWETDEASIRKAEEYGIKITHNDYDKMLEDESIDIVAIGDYFSARGEKIIKALKAGKHVISDKPICTDKNELYEIRKLSVENGLKVGCMLDLRYTFSANKAKELIESGRIGKIHNISFGGQHCLNYKTRSPWYFEEGKQGGTINDIAVHGIDLVRYMTGAGLRNINSARTWNAYAKESPLFNDCAQFMVELDDGIGLIADVSYAAPTGLGYTVKQYWRFTIWGEKGVIEVNVVGDTVELSEENSKETICFSGDGLNSNPFSDFIEEINGRESWFNTSEVLKSAEDVLRIQYFADGKVW